MFGKRYMRSRVMKWERFIETPTGFPDDPPELECWFWIGARTRDRAYPTTVSRSPDAPRAFQMRHKPPEARAKFLGQPVNPHRVLLAYKMNVDLHEVGRTKNTCGDAGCVNPHHWIVTADSYYRPEPHSEPAPEYEPEPVPELDERDRAFKLFYDHSIGIDDTPEIVRSKGIYNQDFIDTHLVDYQSCIYGKTKAEIDEMIEAVFRPST